MSIESLQVHVENALRIVQSMKAGRAPDGRAPDGRAPDGRAPDGRAPDGTEIVESFDSPLGSSPLGSSPLGSSPLGSSPLGSFAFGPNDPPHMEQLHYGVTQGGVKKLLKKYDYTPEELNVGLVRAISHGKIDTAKLLLEKGATMDGALIVLAKTKHYDLTREVIEAGGDLEERNQYGETPYAIAVKHYADGPPRVAIEPNDKMMMLLKDMGANINVQDDEGRTVLHQNIGGGDGEVLVRLIRDGVDYNIRDNNGRTALEKSYRHMYGPNNTIELFRREVMLHEFPDVRGRTCYDFADMEDVDIARFLGGRNPDREDEIRGIAKRIVAREYDIEEEKEPDPFRNMIIVYQGKPTCYNKDSIEVTSENTFYECSELNHGLYPRRETVLDDPYVLVRLINPFLVRKSDIEAVKETGKDVRMFEIVPELDVDDNQKRWGWSTTEDARDHRGSLVSADHCQGGTMKLLYRMKMYNKGLY
jgi:hypothetical protein